MLLPMVRREIYHLEQVMEQVRVEQAVDSMEVAENYLDQNKYLDKRKLILKNYLVWHVWVYID